RDEVDVVDGITRGRLPERRRRLAHALEQQGVTARIAQVEVELGASDNSGRPEVGCRQHAAGAAGHGACEKRGAEAKRALGEGRQAAEGLEVERQVEGRAYSYQTIS